jgi:hypothetical protein
MITVYHIQQPELIHARAVRKALEGIRLPNTCTFSKQHTNATNQLCLFICTGDGGDAAKAVRKALKKHQPPLPTPLLSSSTVACYMLLPVLGQHFLGSALQVCFWGV